MKVMLDTNILVSAFIFKSSKMNELISKLSINHTIVICSYTIEELIKLINKKFKVSLSDLNDFLQAFPFEIAYSPQKVKNKLFQIRDENDYIILHTAIVKKVDVFITGDKDFKDVNIHVPKIMTPTEFLEKYF